MFRYKFSVIIPIYNVEDYIEQTMLSVVNQTIGFKENIQLILINDGSSDNSENICKKYRDMFPDNVVYVEQKNSGVSSARNKGMEYIEGELVTFLDSDDKWDLRAFKEVYRSYLKHKDIKIFSCKMVFFDAKKGEHPLNYKYNEDKIINILEDEKYPQLSSSSLFIHSKLLNNRFYDTSIRYSEDNKFINEILFDELKYMVLKKPTYYYRRRTSGNSAIQKQTHHKDWFLVTPRNVYLYLFELSKEKFGKVIPYIQYLIMYDLNWRLTVDTDTLTTIQKKEYADIISELLSEIDDSIIYEMTTMTFMDKIIFLGLKHHEDYTKKLEYSGKYIKLDNLSVRQSDLNIFVIDNVYFKKNHMYLFGKLNQRLIPKEKFAVYDNNTKIKTDYYELPTNSNTKIYDGTEAQDYIGVKLDISIENHESIKFYFENNIIFPSFGNWSIFCEKLPVTYHYHNNKIIYYKNDGFIIAEKSRLKGAVFEVKNIFSCIKRGNLKSAAIRLYIKFAHLFKRKKIMLISDRLNVAGDNGEHFFKFMVSEHPEYNSYFILSKSSSDYNRICQIGKVLDPQSIKYKLLFQVCDYIVSSQAENYVFNILGKSNSFVRDQYYFKFVFLQHGIIKDDLSAWTNIHSKKIDMYVTSCTKEYDSLLYYKYYFGKGIVKLTGLPRYDNLLKLQKKTPIKKQILLSCTWRASLASNIDRKTGNRIYNPDFKNSAYFRFLDDLINDSRLLDALKEHGYKIKFCVHPNVVVQLKDFHENDYVIIEKNTVNYQKEFCENSLLVTDYSSIFFDFAYLKKPIIYTQFDHDAFFDGQLYNAGYFNYDKMGFGPVCNTIDSTVDAIIKYIEKGCKLEKKYEKRIDSFFTYHDTNNCKRVFEEIEKL